MSSQEQRPARGPSTACLHAHRPEEWPHRPLVMPLVMSASYKYATPEEIPEVLYERYANPTRHTLERTIAELEGAKHCLCFASGMTAFTACAQLLNTGDGVVCSNQIYGGVTHYFEKYGPGKGIDVTFVDLVADPENLRAALRKNTKMVWVEICGNPNLGILDIDKVAEIVSGFSKDILLIVDNTFLTPILMRPLEHGATIVMHSISKYLSGLGDLVMGCLSTNRKDLSEELYQFSKDMGLMAPPFDCFLVSRSLKTLSLRVRQHASNAMAVARFLEGHPAVERVLYPGLPSHPQHALAKRILDRDCYGGVVTFAVKGGLDEVNNLGRNLRVISVAASLGSVDSLVSFPWSSSHCMIPEEARWKMGVTENLVRLSVGIEDIEDLLHDLERGLQAMNPK